jgi:hypothetical protein
MRELDHHYGDLATAIDDREIELCQYSRSLKIEKAPADLTKLQLSCAGFNNPSVVHLLEEEVSKFTGILLTANDDLAELDW